MQLRTLLAFLLALAAASTARAESAAKPFVDIGAVEVTEGDTGRTTFTARILLSNWYQPITVDVIAEPGTATPGDYEFSTQRLTLVPNQPQTVTGAVLGDDVYEGDETFSLRAIQPYGLAGSYAPVTIRDDDAEGASHIAAADLAVTEGASGRIKRELVVRLEPGSDAPVTVHYAALGAGGAIAGVDFIATEGDLTFAPGEQRKVIELEVTGDEIWETNELFEVVFSNPRGALLDRTRVPITIVNDDPEIEVAADDLTVEEGDGGSITVPVRFKWTGQVPPEKIHVSVAGGSASEGLDYTGGFQVVYSNDVSYKLELRGDAVPECDEGIVLKYVNPYNEKPSAKLVHVLIRDDDGGPRGAACPDPYGNVKASDGPVAAPEVGAPEAPVEAPVEARDVDGGAPEGPRSTDAGSGGTAPIRDRVDDEEVGGACSYGGAHPPGAGVLALLMLGSLLLARRKRCRGEVPRRRRGTTQ